LYLTTALACLVILTTVCAKINDPQNGSRALSTPSSIKFQGAITETSDNVQEGRPTDSREIETPTPASDRELLEMLMLEKVRQIQSRRAKGVQVALGGPDDPLSEKHVIAQTRPAFE